MPIVKIDLVGNKLTVDTDPVFTKLGDPVHWQWGASRPKKDFVICFGQESPFHNTHFNQVHSDSGDPTVGARTKPYKYSIEVENQLLDPDVIVDT